MVLYSLVAIVGATMDFGLMWNIAETFNGLMAIPNLIAVFLLSGVVVKLVKNILQGKGKVYRKMKYLAESEFLLSVRYFLISKINTIHLKVGFNSVFGFP